VQRLRALLLSTSRLALASLHFFLTIGQTLQKESKKKEAAKVFKK
jgi:hypothetical protein